MCVCAFACERKGSASAVSSAFIGHLHLCVREIEKERVCVCERENVCVSLCVGI